MTLLVREAVPEDWGRVAALLRTAELPLDGAREHFPDFLVCCDDRELVGAAGLELYDRGTERSDVAASRGGAARRRSYGRTALLRSVVVMDTHRGRGVGRELVRRMLGRARERGACEVVLLTTTAATYFTRFGFREIERAAIPLEAHASTELRGACPDTAVAMHLAL